MENKAIDQVQTMNQKSFQFTIDKCVGCHACVVACSIENQSIQSIPWREINTFNANGLPDIPLFHFSLACNHCEDAPCMKNCPAIAYSKDFSTGAIVHTGNKCIGCKYCTWACPYDAPKFNIKTRIIEKCTFCNHRIVDGFKPACANLCPTGALDFIDKPAELLHQNISGFTDIGIKPAIKIISTSKEKHSLVVSEYQTNLKPRTNIKKHSKISVINEWPLIIFTFLAMILVSVFTSSILGYTKPSADIFVLSGIAGAILSMMHLGKKLRAWRSILNLKNSWLSREIFSFSLFLGLSIFYFFINNHILIGYFTIIIGVISLISIDKVYKCAMQAIPLEIHSAHVLLSFFLFTALFSEAYNALIFIAIIKVILYIYRKFEMRNLKKNHRLLISGLRIDMLVSFPLIFWFFGISNIFWWLTASILIGEIIDRIEYYDELDIITPAKQIEIDLDKKFKME